MKKHLDPLGKMLLRAGVLDEDRLGDVLAQQRHSLPLASMCYVLGHAEEEALARVLSKQRGLPGVVLERSIIRLEVIADVPYELALQGGVLPVREDEARVFVATQDPQNAGPLTEIQFLKGKVVVPHIALQVSLARAIRGCYGIRERGGQYWYGTRAVPSELADPAGVMWVVSDVDELPVDLLQETGPLPAADVSEPEPLPNALETPREIEDASARLLEEISDTLEDEEEQEQAQAGTEEQAPKATPRRPGWVTREGPPKVLIVDDDFATRHLLVKLLEPAQYTCETAASGMEAVKRLKASPPDLVIIDVMLPEINGFQICRSIKRSYKYQHIPVILISAVIESAHVTEELLTKYSADAYFEKPIATDRLKRKVEALLGARPSVPARPAQDDGSFDRALELYRRGEIDQAIALLRGGLEVDPLSTRHHFVLANLLQRKNEIYEAIDEYEATVNLKPDYFPALSRLAYLYYKKGFSARAIETWRRALPHCPDPGIRQNIETFMRKLIAQMQSEG